MENKTRKMKWTKKLRAVIISLSLAFAVALGGACAAIGISVAGRNGRWGGTLSDSTAGSSDITPDRTYSAGVEFDEVTYATNAEAWAAAVKYSVTEKKIVQFNLERGWTATADANGFATEDAKTVYSDAFGAAGSLTVPENATVILNIKKNMRLNRNLTEATENGEVVSVAGGRLIVQGDGVITGGNTNGNGGGINVNAGTLEIYGGKITKNSAPHIGGGIYCEDNSTLNIYGGEISYNQTTTSDGNGGGGVALGKVALTMTGGKIINNTSVDWAGGIMTLNRGANVTISGGAISGNTAGIGGGAMFIGSDTVTISGTTYIANNNASAIAVYNNGVLNIDGGTITKNESASCGGAITINAGTVTISGGEISENKASSLGGGIYTAATGVKNADGSIKTAGLTISGGEISGNTAANSGGGVYVNTDATFAMNGGAISNNTTTSNGGGIYANKATVEMTGGEISYNNSGAAGGGIDGSASNSTIKLLGGSIHHNTSGAHGGGLSIGATDNDMASVTVSGDMKVYGNESKGGRGGGGLYIEGGVNLTMNGGEIYDNSTSGNVNGGGIALFGISSKIAKATISAGTIANNNSSNSGGGIYIASGSILRFNGGKITQNYAEKYGGGIRIDSGMLYMGMPKDYISGEKEVVSTAEISYNTASMSSGGIDTGSNSSYDNTIVIHGGKVTYNKAVNNSHGGVCAEANTNVNISDCEISYNSAGEYSGGLTTRANADHSSIVKNVKILNNSAKTHGGGLYFGGTVTVTDCEITGNTAYGQGGGIYTFGTLLTVNGSTTITNNTASVAGGGIYVGAETTLNGVTVTGNSAPTGGGMFVGAATTLEGIISVTDNYAVKLDEQNKFVADTTRANNLTVNSKSITLGDTFSGSSEIYLNTTATNNTPTTDYYRGCQFAGVSKTETRHSAFKGEDPFRIYTYTGAPTENILFLYKGYTSTGSNTWTNGDQWVNAVNNSSDSNPRQVNLLSNWTAAAGGSFGTTFSSGAEYTSTEADDYSKPYSYYGALVVPEGKNIILNLNGHTIDRALTALYSGGHVFVVDGTLTIIGEGTIKGGYTGIGSGINVGQNGKLIMNGGTVTGCTVVTQGGAIGIYEGGTFIMNGGSISGNTSTTNGGGVYNAGTFIMNGGTIGGSEANKNTSASVGGGVFNIGTFEMNGGTISYNTATSNAGGVHTGGKFTMTGGTIAHNTATSNVGGGVFVESKNGFEMSGGSISNNTAPGFGGGIFIQSSASALISGGTISDNSAPRGGGVYINNAAGTLTMEGGKITGNHATSDTDYGGGGVYIQTSGVFNLIDGTVSNNDAVANGGGVFVMGTLNMSGGSINSNEAKYGGGIWLNGGIVTMSAGEIDGNSVTFFAGAVGIHSGRFTLSGTAAITNNSSVNNGGGIDCGGEFIMLGGEISSNSSSTGLGGGIYCNEDGSLTMSGGKISGNSSKTGGGGVAVDCEFTMSGGEISNNTTEGNGGGVYNAGTFTISGTAVILGNTSVGYGPGGGIYSNGDLTILSGTISGNKAIMGSSTSDTNNIARGGGIWAEGGKIIIGDKDDKTKVTNIINNTAEISGGGLYIQGATLTEVKIYNANISGNTANRNAGGLTVTNTSDSLVAEVVGCKISDNEGISGNGGAISLAAKIIITDTVISNNSTGNFGGGICGESGTELTISGNTVISDNTAFANGGGIYITTGTLNMSGGVISENSGNAGGGVHLNSGSFNFTGGTISGNTATNGGGVHVKTGSLIMTSGTVSGNFAEDSGGGVCVIGDSFKFTGGTISENISSNGGGVYVTTTSLFEMSDKALITGNTSTSYSGGVTIASSCTFNMTGGAISENNANNAGGIGIADTATFNMSGSAVISDNHSTNIGGGVVVLNSGVFAMGGGTISGNTAEYGGGVHVNSGTFTMNGGTISDNSANVHGGGIYVNGTLQLKGNSVVTENFVNGNLNNVYLPADKKITVSGALGANARIGVSTEAEVPVTVTSGYTTSGNTAANARNIFSADKEGVVAVYESNEIVLKQGVVLTVNDDKGTKIGSISTVNGAKVLGAFDEETRIYKLTEENAAANTSGFAFATDVVPEGYAAYMYAYGDADKKEISEFTMGATDATVCIGMKALERDYTIHYYLEGADGSYGTSFLTGTNSGATGSEVVILDENGKPFTDQITTPDQYSVDNTKGNWKGATVAGDGSTVVDVYLKLAEYTVTYTAQGATPSRQTRKMKYGATIIGPARTPSKPMSTFIGWADASGNVIDFATTSIKVTENMTLTAKFDVQTFNLSFNMNIDDAYGIPTDHKLPMYSGELIVPTNAGLEDVDYMVAWDYERLFPAANGFNFRANEDSYGEFIIDYTIDNIPNTMSIRNVKPTAVGYTFDGWYMTNSSGVEQLVTTISRPNVGTKDIVLTAHWSPAAYTVKFDRQDESWNPVSSDTVSNLCTIEELYELGGNPTRAGYVFDGWYIAANEDNARYTAIDTNAFGKTDEDKGYFSVAKIADLYGSAESGYDFSNLTLYAKWSSVPVYVVYDRIDNISLTFANEAGHNGSVGVEAQAMHVNDVVTVGVTANNGFRFTNLIVNGRTQSEGVTEFTIRDTYLTDYDYNGVTYKVIRVSAVCTEERYRINYDVDGGTSTSSNFARTYSPSQLLPTSENRAKLSSNLTKQGYDFMGWEFTSNHAPAFTVDSGVDTTKSLYGKDLWMATPTAADGVTVQYREVFLKAIWKAQPATVNLYNATYNNLYEGSPETGYIIEEYGAAGATSQHLATAMKIEIVNPERSAFNFLGWATSRNGAVVYPAVEGKNTIEYVVNADHDVNGNALNRNNLYAVWHIKGVDRILMSVDNNNATYGGDGITMSAKTAQSYAQGDGETITLTYTWYRIFDGMYDACFTAGYVYIENEKVTGYEFNGVYYGEDGKTEQATAPAGEPYEYKRFETASVGTGCELAFTQSRTPTETSTLNIKNVNECGTYVCVVEVVATSTTGSTTRAGGYGEIEISMSKAVYTNLELNDKTLTYNSEAQWNSLRLERRNNSDGSQFENDDNVIRYVTLPDGSKVIVTYKYYAVEESGRREITDLNEVKGVGRYYVEVSFAFTPDGDKGNYEPLEKLDAEIEIKPFEISNIGFTFVHGDDSTIEQNFAGAYDGTAYSVVAAINQRFDDDGEYVAVKDDVQLVVQVNEVNENGDVEHAGETVKAGRYSVVIIGLQGKDASNYIFKSGVTLRREYTIGKSVYDVSGKIKFEDKTVKFDNKTHSIEIEWEGEWPETVTPVYEITFEPEEAGFKDSSFDQNNKKIGNDGKNAGIYTVTVEFVDSASDNYEALESMTATLTITKANVFEYMEETYGEDLLGAAGFVGGSFAYSESNSYLPTVNPDADCRLNNKTHFAISYKYYVVNEETGVRTELGDGERISNPGKYEIVANITYASALYRNNFDEVQESESTITYIIRNFIVKNVTVIFTDEFEASGRVVKLGKQFDYGWIKQIDVLHEDADTHVQDTRHIIREEDIELAVITLENDYSTFWHVGDFDIRVGVYGTNSAAYNVTVKEDVTDFVIKYRVGDEGTYAVIPDDGLRLLTEGEYSFIIEYECTDGRGAPITTSTEAVVAASGLKLGENVLTATEDYYEFSKIAVNVYKVITGEVTWQYSRDGGLNWYNIADDYPDYVLPYIGSEYLIRVAFTDDGAKSCPAKTASGAPVLNYTRNGYSMVVGRSGNYKIDATYSLSVGQRVLEVDWSDRGNGFTYNGLHQSPVIDPNTVNLAAADKSRITFSYQLEDTEGNGLTENDVIGVGTYVVKVVLNSDDPTYSENYTVVGSKTAAHTFTIHKADISMDVTYSESNYGPNVTYANNAHGLRLNALQANFRQSAVDGKFAFVKAGSTSDEYVEISGDDAEIKGKLTGAESYAYINYAYIPDDDNYNVKIGQFRIDVKSQAYRQSGADSLLIVLGKDAIPHYLVGQTFSTEGISVYRLYESYYTEGDKWFGFRGDAVSNPTFRLNGNIPASGHSILMEDVSGGMITLVASSGPLSGSLQIPVLDKEVDSLEISNTDYRKVFYVGETYDFSDLVFRVIFKDGTDQDGLTKGSVKCTHDGEEFDTAGEVTLTFSYFGATCELTVTVKEKENLQVVDFTTGEKTLIWTGAELTAPALKFLIDGDEYTTYDGIKVEYVVRRGQQVVSLLNEGDYSVYYTVTVTNPRFNKITTPILITVNVTKNPYRVTITVPAAGELTATYTGNEIEIPKPAISDIIDSRTGNVVQPDAVRYYINGTELVNGLNDTRWVQLSVKEYKVEVVVEVDGREFREEYTFHIEQAQNGNLKVEVSTVVLGEGANFKFPVTADFGADSVDDVKYTYSTERDGTYTENVPDKAGIWFVKVIIKGTDDYTGLETVVSFEVRDNKTDASVGDGSIEGGDGIGKDWTLEITDYDVTDEAINKQNVLDGYKVELRNADKVLVKSENAYTVRIKLSEELSGRTDLKVFFKDADGNTKELSGVEVKDGYIKFDTNEFGTFIITSQVAGAPIGLLVAVIVLGVVAAGGIAACIIVFVKKRKKGEQK